VDYIVFLILDADCAISLPLQVWMLEILVISLLITQIFSQLCGEPDPCSNFTCCSCRQIPNLSDGNGFFEFNQDCLDNGGGLHCVSDSGCRLCYKPTFASVNVGNRPVCARFNLLSTKCSDESCCLANQNPNPTNGVGYLEFNQDCLDNGGGLHCVSDSGCRLCFQPILGAVNVGDRPVCERFANVSEPMPFTFPPNCSDITCCIDAQNPNQDNGNGFLEFSQDCKDNGGGLGCVADSGCSLCYKPVLGGVNVGNRSICERYLNLTLSCSDEECCLDAQNVSQNDGTGYLEFNSDCAVNGGLNCVADSGCSLCYKPVLGGVNVGDRPVCQRFSL